MVNAVFSCQLSRLGGAIEVKKRQGGQKGHVRTFLGGPLGKDGRPTDDGAASLLEEAFGGLQ